MVTNHQEKKRPKISDIVKPDKIIEKYGKQYAKYDKIYGDYEKVNPEIHINQKDYMLTKYHKFSSYYNSEYGTTTDALEYYTEDSYGFNKYLRHKRWLERGEITKEEFDNELDFLSESFIEFDKRENDLNKELQFLRENMVFYSGQDKIYYSDFQKGDVVKFDSFISTTLNKKITEKFGHDGCKALFIIYAEKNDKLIPALARSEYPDECEMILPPDTEIEILNVIQEKFSNNVTYECKILTKY